MKKPSLRQQIAKYLYDRYEPATRVAGSQLQSPLPYEAATAAKHHEWTEIADWCIRKVREHDKKQQRPLTLAQVERSMEEILARRMQEL